MLVYGSNDNIVPQCMGIRFYERLQSVGVEAEFYSHDGGHEVAEQFTDEMIAFFNRIKNSAQAIDEVSGESKVESQKSIRDGVLLIERNGKTYNALGAEIK